MTGQAQHLADDILDAARLLVLERGVLSAMVDAIAKESRAPVGSLYHRFGSRDRLMAELWIRAVRRSQAAFLAAVVGHADAEQSGVDAALSIYDFVRQHRADARLLASFRREDLLHDARAPKLIRELKELNGPLEKAVMNLARRLFQKASQFAVEQTILAVIDIPMGVLRPHLLSGREVPLSLRGQLEGLVRTVLRAAREAV